MPRGVPNKKETETSDFSFETLKELGIPVKAAIFERTVRFGMQGTPEQALYDPSQKSKKSRTAEMWYTPAGLLCVQGDYKKLIPLGNVKDTDLL